MARHVNMKQIDGIADILVKYLSNNGFIIQRYDAYSSDSVYLKLDFGVSNSIRISDHPGKERLEYRYNVIIGGEDNIIEEKWIRYFFSEKSIQALINQIIFDRMEKTKKYGRYLYFTFMKNNIKNSEGNDGFWKTSKLLTTEWRLGMNEPPSAVFKQSANGHIEAVSDTVS